MPKLMSARTHVIMLAGAIVATITAQAQAGRYVPVQAPNEPGGSGATSPEDMPDGLRQAVSDAIDRDARRIRPAADRDSPPVYEAVNRVNDLRFRFRTDGVEAAPQDDRPANPQLPRRAPGSLCLSRESRVKTRPRGW